jgi:polysaccharide biosynthesis protein VpsM
MRQIAGLLAVCLTFCYLEVSPAYAQDPESGSDGASGVEDVGGPRIKASVRSVAYYTDNFYNQPSGHTEGYGTLISPELSILQQTTKLELVSVINAEYGAFDLPGSQDDYLDGGVRVRFAMQPTLRNKLWLDGAFRHGHDPFGVDRTEDATVRYDELDRWNQAQGGVHYRYGAPGARLNAELGAGGLQKHYTSNRAATEVLNYDSTFVNYVLSYNYSAKTAALIDFSRSDFRFEESFGTADTRGGELYRARVGVKWLATGKTSGDVRVGHRRRTFDSGSDDFEGVDWEAGVDWAPVVRTTLRLQTARSEQESYRADARIIDIQSIMLDWKYTLTARTGSNVRLEYITADFDTSGRTDQIVSGGIGMHHFVLGNLWVVGNVGLTDRASSIDAREYERLSAYVGIRFGRP